MNKYGTPWEKHSEAMNKAVNTHIVLEDNIWYGEVKELNIMVEAEELPDLYQKLYNARDNYFKKVFGLDTFWQQDNFEKDYYDLAKDFNKLFSMYLNEVNHSKMLFNRLVDGGLADPWTPQQKKKNDELYKAMIKEYEAFKKKAGI